MLLGHQEGLGLSGHHDGRRQELQRGFGRKDRVRGRQGEGRRMNLADVRAELEEELAWRKEEIRFLKNQMTEMKTEDERERFRRALVVMLYSHFEGYWRAAFSTYVKALNSTNTRC